MVYGGKTMLGKRFVWHSHYFAVLGHLTGPFFARNFGGLSRRLFDRSIRRVQLIQTNDVVMIERIVASEPRHGICTNGTHPIE